MSAACSNCADRCHFSPSQFLSHLHSHKRFTRPPRMLCSMRKALNVFFCTHWEKALHEGGHKNVHLIVCCSWWMDEWMNFSNIQSRGQLTTFSLECTISSLFTPWETFKGSLQEISPSQDPWRAFWFHSQENLLTLDSHYFILLYIHLRGRHWYVFPYPMAFRFPFLLCLSTRTKSYSMWFFSYVAA